MKQEIEELKAEIEEANDNADWWHNRYEAQVKITDKYKSTIDKIKEKVNQYELIKGYYDYIEENGYVETTSHDTLKEDILELLEEIK